MVSPIDVSVIVPTTASKAREAQLKRAVESIRRSASGPVRIIAVVNGGHADPGVCQWLEAQPDVHYERVATPSLPLAIFRGREVVQTPYFSMLDDDDEYLVGGTDLKLSAFAGPAGADVVITSGFRQIEQVDEPAMISMDRVPNEPLRCLFESNWLSSCNALYKSSSFPPAFFVDPHPYAEWTWLAFKIALAKKQLVAINQPTFRIHDTPGSLSKSDSYHDAYQALYRRMLEVDPPADIARTIKIRMSSDWHQQATRALSRGNRRNAIACHFRSLVLPAGLQYLTYTRYLIPGWPIS